VAVISKQQIYEELLARKNNIYNPFPYDDTDKIQIDFKEELSGYECLTGDLNTYWMNIAGCLSYVLNGNEKSIPQGQLEWLRLNFFDIFIQYKFLEEKIEDYPAFLEEYSRHERVRLLLLSHLSLR
jgi:YxiJ-like protein